MSDSSRFTVEIQEALKKFRCWIESIDWEKVSEVIAYIQNELPEKIEKLFVQLANKGWFVWDMEKPLGEYISVVTSILDKNYEEQEQFLVSHIEAEMDEIEAKLLKKYPDRETQITDAFGAHRIELYGASVPTFISLAEGICKDHYPQIGLYSKHPGDKRKTTKPGAPRTDDIFDEIPPLEVWEEIVLKPLRVSSDVTKSIHMPTEEEHSIFNRHLIMHGASKKYGNKINSLKSISLVNFVHGSLSYLESKSDNIQYSFSANVSAD